MKLVSAVAAGGGRCPVAVLGTADGGATGATSTSAASKLAVPSAPQS